MKVVSNEQVRVHSGNIFKNSLGCFIFLWKHRGFVRFEPLHGLENNFTKKNVVGFINASPPTHLK